MTATHGERLRRSAPAPPANRLPVPVWLPALTLLLSVAALGVATYLTVAHYDTHVALACSDKGAIDCAAVTTSSESSLFGIPVAVLGLAYFAVLPAFFLPASWRSPAMWVRRGRVAAIGAGMAFVLWLLYAELIDIGKICLYCTLVHVITLLLFVLVLVGTVLTAPDPSPDEVSPAG